MGKQTDRQHKPRWSDVLDHAGGDEVQQRHHSEGYPLHGEKPQEIIHNNTKKDGLFNVARQPHWPQVREPNDMRIAMQPLVITQYGSIQTIISIMLLQIDSFTDGIKFPNDVDGQPEIQCNEGNVRITVKTTNGVASHMFTKGHYSNIGCSFERTNSATFSIGACGMNRQRQLEPRGITYGVVVVVQLHPLFMTKVDRAYNLKCFYMETDKSVTALLDVSMLSTQSITNEPPMPVCVYDLHTDGAAGPSARYARVGDPVWHSWTCPSSTFGMLVHSCYVSDGEGNEFQIIDQQGCGVDQYVMRTPEYSSDLTSAQQETHVFKFADKTALVFNCQIKLCNKANDSCDGLTPPSCPQTNETLGNETLFNETLSNFTITSFNFTELSEPNLTTISAENATEITTTTSPALGNITTSSIGEVSETSVQSSESSTSSAATSSGPAVVTLTSPASTTQATSTSAGSTEATPSSAGSTETTSSSSQVTATSPSQGISTSSSVTSLGTTSNATLGTEITSTITNATSGIEVTINTTSGVQQFTSVSSPVAFENVTSNETGSFNETQLGNETEVTLVPEVENITESSGLVPIGEEYVTNQSSIESITPQVLLLRALDGRGRRNVLLHGLPNAIDEEETSERDAADFESIPTRHENRVKGRSFHGTEQSDDIETDVSQSMWVLEPEEGPAGDNHHKTPHSRHRPGALNVDGEIDSENADTQTKATPQNPNGVCMSMKTVLAIVIPILAVLIATVGAIVLCVYRLRNESAFLTIRHMFPFVYMYKNE